MVSQVRFRAVLPLLVMEVLFTLPSTSTGSKYVWEDTINISLRVFYPENEITSLLPEGYPSEFWVWDFENIQAAATEEGLVLTADEGYMLPESITAKIGETTFSVKTDGTEAPEGIAFEPETGLLTISQELTAAARVTVTAPGVEIPKSEEESTKEPIET